MIFLLYKIENRGEEIISERNKPRNYKKLAILERSIPNIGGTDILFKGEDTKDISSLTSKEKTILEKYLENIFLD